MAERAVSNTIPRSARVYVAGHSRILGSLASQVNWNVSEYRRTLFKKLNFHPSTDHVVLDLGCGNGQDAAYWSNTARHMVGVDLQHDPGWRLLHASGISFMVADSVRLPFADDTFNVVFLKDTLHHVAELDDTLLEIVRVLKPSGHAVIVEANRWNPIFYVHMTRMLGHDHFTTKCFKSIVLRHFPEAQFIRLATRVYPTTDPTLVSALHAIEHVFERLPAMRAFAPYNVAIAKSVKGGATT